jgi:hypothetical protein
MQATHRAAEPWHKPCTRCRKPTFEDLLDEHGLCDYCREIVAIKVSSRKTAKDTAAAMKIVPVEPPTMATPGDVIRRRPTHEGKG